MYKVQKMYSRMTATAGTYREAADMAEKAASVHSKDSFIISEERGGRWYRRAIVGSKYEVIPHTDGYEIRKRDGERWLHLVKVYCGEYTWSQESSNAKPYKTIRAAQDAMILIASRRA